MNIKVTHKSSLANDAKACVYCQNFGEFEVAFENAEKTWRVCAPDLGLLVVRLGQIEA